MEFLINLPLLTIVLGFVSVVLSSITPRKVAKIITICIQSLATIFGALVIVYTSKYGSVTYQLGHMAAPFCNQIRFGQFEAVLATLVPVVLLLSTLAGGPHTERDVGENKQHFFYTLLNLILVSVVALVYTDDIFTGYVFLEISTLASIGVTAIKNHGRQIAAALRYMIFNLLGSALFLLGCIFIYGETGYLSMSSCQKVITDLFANNQNVTALIISMTLITIGLGIKSGMFPFYFWMGDTYGQNTSTASSVLSGLISKGYIILLLKMIHRTFGYENIVNHTKLIDVLVVIGALGMIFGSITAIRQKSMNRMVSYSSAAQIGYIYLGLGLGQAGLIAACFHIITHALCKPLLFNCSNRLIDAMGKKRKFNNLRGVGHVDILAGIGFTIGALSMVGCPFLVGFVSKYLFISQALNSTEVYKIVITVIALVISTLLNAIYYIRTVITIYSPNKDNKEEKPQRTKYNIGFIVAFVGFVGLIVGLGINPSAVIEFISNGVETLGEIIILE